MSMAILPKFVIGYDAQPFLKRVLRKRSRQNSAGMHRSYKWRVKMRRDHEKLR
jgi:hypothetical protein